ASKCIANASRDLLSLAGSFCSKTSRFFFGTLSVCLKLSRYAARFFFGTSSAFFKLSSYSPRLFFKPCLLQELVGAAFGFVDNTHRFLYERRRYLHRRYNALANTFKLCRWYSRFKRWVITHHARRSKSDCSFLGNIMSCQHCLGNFTNKVVRNIVCCC